MDQIVITFYNEWYWDYMEEYYWLTVVGDPTPVEDRYMNYVLNNFPAKFDRTQIYKLKKYVIMNMLREYEMNDN